MDLLLELKKHDDSNLIWVLGAYLLALVVVVWAGYAIARMLAKKRQSKRVDWAGKYGFRLIDGPKGKEQDRVSQETLERYRGYGLPEADRAAADNIFEGQFEGFNVRLFDYFHSLGTGDDVVTYNFGIVSFELPAAANTIQFMSRRIRDMIDKERDLDFSHKPEFNKRFHVFTDGDGILARKMSQPLEHELIESPIYECLVYDRLVVLKAANKIGDAKYDALLACGARLAKLISSEPAHIRA